MATVIDSTAELSFKTCARCGKNKQRTDFENNRSRICNECKKEDVNRAIEAAAKMAEKQALESEIFGVIRRTLDIEKIATVRHLFYKVEGAGLVSKVDGYEKYVQPLVLRWRREGLIGWHEVIDPTRERPMNIHFEGLDDYKYTVLNAYKLDYWKTQPTLVEAWTEKAAMVGILEHIVEKIGLKNLPVVALRGHASDTMLFEASKIFESAIQSGRNVKIIYLGDLDPSGVAIPDKALDKLAAQFGIQVDLERLAVNPEDIDRFGLQTRDLKATDNQLPKFKAKYGINYGCEIDTLDIPVLEKKMADAVVNSNVMDFDAWNGAKSQEERDKAWIKEMFGGV
jgi:hypothetical protein